MKIDKVVFACSESNDYTSFWNIQSKIYCQSLDIEPVCLLYGKKANTNMSEEYGCIVEMETIPDLLWSTQLTWSKFNYPATEPEKVWMIGDIDMIPLQKNYFTSALSGIDPDAYVHLNAGGSAVPRLGMRDGFIKHGSQRHGKDSGKTPGCDLPGHYHVAKGKLYEKLFIQGRSFADQVRYIIESDRYGLGPYGAEAPHRKTEAPYWYYWLAEESYSSELIWNAILNNSINFVPTYYDNDNDKQRIDRCQWNDAKKDYTYSPQKLANRQIVDIHCIRPFERAGEAITRIINASGILG